MAADVGKVMAYIWVNDHMLMGKYELLIYKPGKMKKYFTNLSCWAIWG